MVSLHWLWSLVHSTDFQQYSSQNCLQVSQQHSVWSSVFRTGVFFPSPPGLYQGRRMLWVLVVSEATALSHFAADCLRFSVKTFPYPSFLIIPSILMRFTAPVTMKHPHSILLPQHFTVGMLFFGLHASPFFKHEQDLFSQELQFHLFWVTYVLPIYIIFFLVILSKLGLYFAVLAFLLVYNLAVHCCAGF